MRLTPKLNPLMVEMLRCPDTVTRYMVRAYVDHVRKMSESDHYHNYMNTHWAAELHNLTRHIDTTEVTITDDWQWELQAQLLVKRKSLGLSFQHKCAVSRLHSITFAGAVTGYGGFDRYRAAPVWRVTGDGKMFKYTPWGSSRTAVVSECVYAGADYRVYAKL